MKDLTNTIDQLYVVFSRYKTTTLSNCEFCYDANERLYHSVTPIRELSVAASRKLLWEAYDHWNNTSAFKYALPRLLEILAPPISEEDIYPAHILQIIDNHDFINWAPDERTLVLTFLDEVAPFFTLFEASDWQDWNSSLARLKQESPNA